MFDRSRLLIKPLSERIHNLTIKDILPLDANIKIIDSPELEIVANRIIKARKTDSPIILFMGAHVIRRGNSNFIIDLMNRGFISHIGVNGACVIHDYEFAKIGATTESVSRYISKGQFGLWKETSEINNIVNQAYEENLGLGEAIGRAIEQGDFPYKSVSIFANGYKLQIPVTVHSSIGQDIIHEHPNFEGTSHGETSYRDFLIFAQTMLSLQH